jgi:hypothetical protein
MVEILENVRGKDVFVLQPTCAPTNDHLMEVLVMVDALKRASAGRITAALPYFGYARQDRRVRSMRVAISAKVVANMLQIAGVERLLTMDLHADQIQGFFDIPVDNIYAAPLLLADVHKQEFDNVMVVSPDVGGVVRARALAKRMDCDLAIIDKRRPKANVAEVMNIIGDVSGRTCVIMDDMVDTANTLVKAAGALKERARSVCSPIARTRCCPVARSIASPPRRSTNWSSPTPFPCPRTPGLPPRFACSAARNCWPRPSCASIAPIRSRPCSSTDRRAARADPVDPLSVFRVRSLSGSDICNALSFWSRTQGFMRRVR